MSMIPCQCCGKQYPASNNWYVCNKCNYRICPFCISKHKGRYGSGFKCSQCIMGQMKGYVTF